MNSNFATTLPLPTPNYVLLNEKIRISPTVMPLRSGRKCIALYGFSDKTPYDSFRDSSKLILTPFPLVKGYLQTLIDSDSDDLHLVILDACGPIETRVYAATMDAVLAAQKSQVGTVVVQYTLAFNEESNSYQVLELA
jgi:hypothetical protein